MTDGLARMQPLDDPWQELLEAASDVLADALPLYGPGQPTQQLSPSMERLLTAVQVIDPPDNDLPN